MDSPLKQRLIGAAVLAALAIIFLPMLLKGPDVKEPDAAQVPLTMPGAPDQAFSTHELPLTGPDTHTPSGGVLGMDTRPAPKPDANAVPASAATNVVPAATTDTAVYPTVTPVPAPTAGAPTSTSPVTTAAAPANTLPAPKPTAAVAAATTRATTVPTPTPTTPVLAPDAAPATVKPSAVAAGNYVVNVGSFSNIGNANALVARLKAAGLPTTSEKVKLNGADALRIHVGPYVDRTAAEAARLRAEAMAGGTSKVIALDAEERPSAPVNVAVATKPVTMTPAPAPTPTPAVTPSKPATAVTSGFAVQLAAPAEESAALSLRDRARAAGFSAFVQRVDTAAGTRFRVRAGPVADHNAAEVMRDSINQKLGISGNIVAHP
ncbi:MAG TPA: SPOR domain-containing protein [Luteimonas sp.]|nr:SPOR domain-containing protein [Luteimonas sp.]